MSTGARDVRSPPSYNKMLTSILTTATCCTTLALAPEQPPGLAKPEEPKLGPRWLNRKWDQSTVLFASPFAGRFWREYGAEVTVARVIGLKWTFLSLGMTVGAGDLDLVTIDPLTLEIEEDTEHTFFLRIAPEIRFGWTKGRTALYAITGLGAGFALIEGTPYFSPNVGLGCKVLVTRGLFVGAEAGLRFDYDNAPDISLVAGWRFGR